MYLRIPLILLEAQMKTTREWKISLFEILRQNLRIKCPNKSSKKKFKNNADVWMIARR